MKIPPYHITGILSAFFFLINTTGIFLQIRKIRSREKGRRTSVISIDQTFTTFLGYYTLFVYGYSVASFNHYLVWPRLLAIPLVIYILWEIKGERGSWLASFAFWLSIVLFVISIAGLIGGIHFRVEAQVFSRILVVFLTMLFIQSYIHQIIKIRRKRSTGAISLWMYVLGLASDLANVAFGFLMGISEGWPLILDCGTTTVLRLVLLGHFLWLSDSKSLDRKDK